MKLNHSSSEPADDSPGAPRRVGLEDLLDAVRQFVAGVAPGRRPTGLAIRLDDGDQIRLPVASPAGWWADHSPDFRTINWYGRTYRLSPVQAAVVRELWEATERGAPEVGQAALLEAAGSHGNRVRDVFRNNRIWTDGVVGPGEARGTFRLYRPDETGAGDRPPRLRVQPAEGQAEQD